MATQRNDDGPGKETKKGMSSPYPRQSTPQSSKNASLPPSEKRPPNYLKATLSSGHLNPSSTPPPSPPNTRIKQPSSSTSSNTAAAASRTHQYPHKPTLNRRRSFDKPPPPSATTATPHPLQKSQTFVSSHPSSAAGADRRRRSLDKPPSPSRFHKSPQSSTTNSNSVKPIRKSNSLTKLGQTRSLKLAPKDGGKSYSLYTGINSFKKITKDINPSTSTAAAAASDADNVSTTTTTITKAAPISTDSSPDHDHSTAAPTIEPQTGENQESLLVHSSDFEEVEDSDIDQVSTTESIPAALEEKVQVHRHDDEDLKSYCDSSSTVLEDQNESMDVEIEGPSRDKERTLPVDEETNDQKEDRNKDENDNESCSLAKPEVGGEEKEREEEEIGETGNDNENENSSGKASEDQELKVNDQANQSEPDSELEPESELELKPELKAIIELEPEPEPKPESEVKVEPEPEAKAEVQNVAGATRQGGQWKKESAPVYNDVIEQTASKLLEKRKNKVKALVGAFETVMSLQEPEA